MGVWFTTCSSQSESFTNSSGTTLQTLEAFREQIMEICIKIIDPQESELVKELMQLCAHLGDVEAMIYCTKLVVPYRWDIWRLQGLVETLRVWTQVDTREPCEDPKQVLNELFQQHGVWIEEENESTSQRW
ncbi:hypothetical protein GpartN1_g7013.t1 [Galdieria partita]|uniref:Uncharacterized protein n=1 Tax=Galdieria partita TaxID=83374 RepID=A0A9C7Q583_9RHOD|nr:hypothetical protein GpartN1_g6483.t1 [Galdieria partita]GJQ15222.1 hypothetical protein GpartN1_g7013.t1 [Galdieria partita]